MLKNTTFKPVRLKPSGNPYNRYTNTDNIKINMEMLK